MNISDPQTYREMAAALHDLAERTARPDRRERLGDLARRCELMAARIEQGINDNPSEVSLGGDAA